MDSRIKRKSFAILGVLLLCVIAIQARATTITVTNTSDSGPGSLRQALVIANDGDTITFAVTGTIGLTSGGLLIAKNVTISGPGPSQLSVDGNQAYSVIGLVRGKTATISGLSIRNGLDGVENDHGALTVSNCIVSGNAFAGLYNNAAYNGQTFGTASLTIVNSVVSDNSGSGVRNFVWKESGTLTILNSTISSNSATGDSGGGIYNHGFEGNAITTVTNTTVSGNSANAGGGIFSSSSFLIIANSTISGNSATGYLGVGGGVYNDEYGGYGPLEIVNSTITCNSAGTIGGGIYNVRAGWLVIANSTLSGNSAGSGGGIYNDHQPYATPLVEIYCSILNAGLSGENIFNNDGTVTSHGYNVSSDNAGGYLNSPGDQVNTDPLLGPLQDNGGPTLTHAPLPGSPAIDAGDPNFAPPPFYDQRGCPFVRVFNGRIDVGSFEAQPLRRPCSTPRPRPTPAPR
jgi:hypothetical protein